MAIKSLISAALFGAICVSAVGQPGSPFVGGVWSGNVSTTAATVALRLTAPGLRVRLQVSQNENLTPAVFSSVATTATASGHAVKLTVQGLQPDTDYYYGIEVGGVLRTEMVSRGRFRTFPLGKSSFRIALGSCGDFRSADQSAYDAIMRERPLLFINMGDLHYSDTNSTNAEDYRANYDNVLGHREQGALYRSVPMAYVWDDHDFSGNDSDTTSIGRDAARAAYRERVPHYPLGATGGSIGQAFTIGRVRFIMTDLRSASSPAAQRDNASKTKLGTAQKNWFKQELISARDNGFPLIVWVNPDPWIGAPAAGEDTWQGYATERTEIANFIRDNRVSNVVIVSGDMHGLAVDDGTNSDYATGGGAPLTVLHAAALTSNGSIKGGPYSGGVLPGSQQYGILEVYDNGGDSVACRFLGKKVGEGAKLTHIFSGSTGGAAKDHAIVNISTLARVNSGDDALVSGFVISGASNRRVLVRAIGPTLSAFGVADALAQPVLSIHQAGRHIATNSGWAGASSVATEATLDAFDRAGAFRLVDETSRDAALVLSLAPGAYTVQVKSGDASPGATLLEVYDLP
ncbi:MAG: alkaline phosphatase D family protein [Opitutaceae bacterium]|nr:alkaline phosphatase D family protein [Opitutaceae bacterium]